MEAIVQHLRNIALTPPYQSTSNLLVPLSLYSYLLFDPRDTIPTHHASRPCLFYPFLDPLEQFPYGYAHPPVEDL